MSLCGAGVIMLGSVTCELASASVRLSLPRAFAMATELITLIFSCSCSMVLCREQIFPWMLSWPTTCPSCLRVQDIQEAKAGEIVAMFGIDCATGEYVVIGLLNIGYV